MKNILLEVYAQDPENHESFDNDIYSKRLFEERKCYYWKYSDELFDWFYSRLKFERNGNYFESINIDIEETRNDNKEDGCRIRLLDGTYIKLQESNFLFEVSEKEMKAIQAGHFYKNVTITDLVNYFYSEKFIK